MKISIPALIACHFMLLSGACAAQPYNTGAGSTLRVASWNLGWHVTQAEVPNWIERCGKSFRKNTATGRWDLVSADSYGATVGWFIKESRPSVEGVDLAVMPPCSVYQADFSGVAVTPEAYALRMRQMAEILTTKVNADIIAFQEVSGSAAVREALGSQSDAYHVCSYDGQHAIQRLAFAWRKPLGELVEPCRTHDAVALMDRPPGDRPRPAYSMALRINGKTTRFMTVHLKSSCVSSLDRGQLDDSASKDCSILQQQLGPLETAVEDIAKGDTPFIVLGDFNRNLWHELEAVKGSEPVRSNGETDLKKPREPSVTSKNLFREVFDGEPGGAVKLLSLTCPGTPDLQTLCDAAKTRVLDRSTELSVLSGAKGLGCRNPIGLDHFVVSSELALRVTSATKVPLGSLGGTRSPTADKPQPLLAVSDHCPIVATFTFN